MGQNQEKIGRLASKNAISGLISQILIIFLNFVGRTIFVRFLSNEYLGINGLFANVLTILSFAELGIGEAMVYAMYKPMKEQDYDKLNALMALYKKAYMIIAIIVAVVGVSASFFIEKIVLEKPNITENFQVLFLIYLANTVASYFLTYKKSILFADQKRFITIYVQVMFAVLQLIAQIIVLVIFKSFLLYLIVQVACSLLSNLSISIYVNRKYPKLSRKFTPLPKEESKSIFGNVKSLATTKFAGIIGSGTDNIIASNLVGLGIVGLASNYSMVVNATNTLLWSALYGLTNSIGYFNVESTLQKKREVFDLLYDSTFIIFCIIGVCIVALINPFVKDVWLGENFVMQELVAYSLVLSIFVGGMNYASYSFRVTLGHFKEVQFFYVAYAVLNVFLSIWWGKLWGIVGIFLATSVSRLITAEAADGYCVYKKILNRNPLRYYLRDIYSLLVFSVLCYGVTILVGLINIDGVGGFAIKTLVALIATAITTILSVSWSPSARKIFSRIKTKFSKK